jgi:hypothetical protein
MRKHLPSFVVLAVSIFTECWPFSICYSQKTLGLYNVVSLTAESPLSAVFYLMPRKTAPSVTLRNLMYAMGESGV